MNLPDMKNVDAIEPRLLQLTHYINEHDKKASVTMTEQPKIIALMKIASESFTDKLIWEGQKPATSQELADKLTAFRHI